MKLNSILNRYIFNEMIPPFLINLVFFTFVFLMTKILDITNLIVNYRIDLSAVLLILIYSVPYFLEFVIPVSVMMTVLLTFLRLSSDNEIVALKAGGMSIYGLLPSVFLFCFIGCLLTGFMSIYGLPWGRLSTKALTFKVATSNLDMGLKAKTFNECFKGVMLYINKIDLKDKSLIDVFIEDKRSENIVSTIIAPKGKMFSEPDKLAFHLRLYDGTINQVALESKSVHSVDFDTYDINLNLAKAISVAKGEQKHKKEMSLAELHRFVKTADRKDALYYSMLIEFHKKFSIPFACFALGLLAVPLGMVSSPAKRSFGLGLGLISILLYYLLLSAGKVFGETGIYPPAIGMWVPNIFIGGIGVFVLVRTGKERPLRIDVVPDWVKRIISRFSVH